MQARTRTLSLTALRPRPSHRPRTVLRGGGAAQLGFAVHLQEDVPRQTGLAVPTTLPKPQDLVRLLDVTPPLPPLPHMMSQENLRVTRRDTCA